MISATSNAENILAGLHERLQALMPGGEVMEHGMQAAAGEQLALCLDRIHTRGTASDGSDIGHYSSTPMYANPERYHASFSPVGKTGRSTFVKSGQPHRTRYFDQGYRAFREAMGLPSDKVVLTLSGALRDGLTVIKTGSGYGLGWDNAELHALAQQLEQRYGQPIWPPTAGEQQQIREAIQISVRDHLKK
jgi:hypothetical protein